jgi:hypothetical protein
MSNERAAKQKGGQVQQFNDWSDAFAVCREMDRPITVAVPVNGMVEVARIFPSGFYQHIRYEPKAKGSVELDLNKPDVPYPMLVATRLARLAEEMEDIAKMLPNLGANENAAQLRGAATMAIEWSKAIHAVVGSSKVHK